MARRKASHHRTQEAITQQASAAFNTAVYRFGRFPLASRVALVFLGVLTFFFVFFPLVRFAALDGSASSVLRFLSLWFWKSSVVILVVLATLWGRYLSPRFKQTVHNTLWFKDNDYLFSFFLLFILLSLLVGVQETIAFASDITTTVSVTFGYYVVLLLTLVGLIYSLLKLLDEAKIMRKTDFMGFIQSSKKEDDDHRPDVSSLFDSDDIPEDSE